ncbi:MAG: GNAT family N-acetyltransferase [Methanobrevibacter sp.]|uniref:bifunctional UDP-2,4-diacetamido-2,4,6-trideoxy-beta-L-altropyranose hydrolase/GNAT family N-acetyltransferase n=1 Tax=Methanobrevibacter sp. TaxID=66852 RepID=UPI0025E22059|nr:bifunctional UDP-2,4-diacetamido-2,4,6-trideoxy-beta-L-altropyranose hydrolase/GNAT family N-acetyltransferase [Methanobrevibacter sp.]MBE6508523.1 GNAT family N-acetyltransferase [Methanobrevibacter sp.]
MKVVILTEGGKDYGYGHVARCSSIYQAFEHYNISPRFIVNGDESIKSIVPDIPVEITDWLNKSFKADIIVIDSYLADLTFYNEISKNSSLCVYIDDNNRLDYPKGIVVNGTLDTSAMGYLERGDITYLVGSEFIPLRNDFWNIQKLKINDSIENILITLGGNDLRNLTPKILKLLNENFPEVNKKVIIADSFKNTHEIESLKNNHVELIYSPDSDEIINAMSSVDLAISASGQTLYELACIGVPTVAIGIIDNQKNNIKNWINQGFIEYAGCWNDDNLLDNILDRINYLQDNGIRFDKRLLGIQAVNGKGSLKIVKNILNEFYKNNSTFRSIQKEDCLKIFEIANDDDVRKSSFNSEKIQLEDHKKWFNNILNDDSVKFHVLEYETDLIGQLRLDFDEKYPVISISLNKKYRGLGLSKILLSEGLKLIDGKVVAYIKKDNVRSISFFKSMGFKKEGDVVIKNCDALKFIKG